MTFDRLVRVEQIAPGPAYRVFAARHQYVTLTARYLIACGLIGEPVAPVITSGGPQKKNS